MLAAAAAACCSRLLSPTPLPVNSASFGAIRGIRLGPAEGPPGAQCAEVSYALPAQAAAALMVRRWPRGRVLGVRGLPPARIYLSCMPGVYHVRCALAAVVAPWARASHCCPRPLAALLPAGPECHRRKPPLRLTAAASAVLAASQRALRHAHQQRRRRHRRAGAPAAAAAAAAARGGGRPPGAGGALCEPS